MTGTEKAPKEERAGKLSLQPLSFDEAVERILKSPPPQRANASRKPRREPRARRS